jgi:phosphatidate cytidylyltransferase
MIDGPILVLLGVVGAILVVATLVGRAVARQASTARQRAAAADLQRRIHAWWGMIPVMVGCLWLEWPGILGFFAVVSFLALRELITLVPTHRADHTTLLLAFLFAVPVQYGLVWTGWTGLFLVFVPVWMLLVVSVRVALTGDPRDYLRRVAAIQYVLLVGVYALSHAPAMRLLDLDGLAGREHLLVVFLVVVTQASDVLQFIWGKLAGRTPLLPMVSPHKTVEGLVGGLGSTIVVGALLAPLLPFPRWETAVLAGITATAGWLGGVVLSAIKRDAGVKDYGRLIRGHGGILDRADSLVFAAPVLFHVLWWVHG